MLVDLKRSHLNDIFEYSKDPEFSRYIGMDLPNRLSDVMPFLNLILMENKFGRRRYFGIEIEGKVIGTAGLLNINEDSNSAELGFGLSRKYWGTGTMKVHVDQIIKIGFKDLGLEFLTVGTSILNSRSNKFITKTGFLFTHSLNDKYWYKLQKVNYENCCT